jgi:hypothetical protein
MAGIPLAVGTVLPAGADTPPTTTKKSLYVAIYNGVLAALAGIPALIPDLDTNVKVYITIAAFILSAIGSPIIALLQPNQLQQAVQIVDDPPGAHEAPEV